MKPSLGKNVLLNFCGNATTLVFNVALVPVYIRILGSESYGLVVLYGTIKAASGILDLGVGLTFNKEMAQERIGAEQIEWHRKVIDTLEVVYWVIAIILGIIVCLMSSFLANRWLNIESLSSAETQQNILIMGGILLLRWPISFYNNGLSGKGQFFELNSFKIVFTCCQGLGALIVLFFVWTNVAAYLLWQLIIEGIYVATLYCYFKRRYCFSYSIGKHFSISVLWNLKNYTIGVGLYSLLALLMLLIDKVILSRMLSLESLAHYGLISSVALAILQVVYPFSGALFPRIAAYAGSEKRKSIAATRASLAQAFQGINLLTSVGTLTFITYKEYILGLWVRDSVIVEECLPLVFPLMLGGYVYAIRIGFNTCFLALGKSKTIVRIMSILMVAYVVGLLLFIPKSGMTGAAFAWLTMNCLGLVFIAFEWQRCRECKDLQSTFYETLGIPVFWIVSANFFLLGLYSLGFTTGYTFLDMIGHFLILFIVGYRSSDKVGRIWERLR